jgi:hypothetical protein
MEVYLLKITVISSAGTDTKKLGDSSCHTIDMGPLVCLTEVSAAIFASLGSSENLTGSTKL